jgi:biotin carboxyl carrier protein
VATSDLRVEWRDRAWRVTVAADGATITEEDARDGAGAARVEIAPAAAQASRGEVLLKNGERVNRVFVARHGDVRWVFHDGRVFEFTVEPASPSGARRKTGHHHGPLTAPMPATVIGVLVEPGDHVSRGQTLIVLEAMKMELPLRASGEGIVRAVRCREGDLVQPGASLIEIE